MTEEAIATRTEPVRRPLLGIVFSYLAGTLAGAWFTGFHFLSVLAAALFVLAIVSGLHYPTRLLQAETRLARFSQQTIFLSRFMPGLANGLLSLAVFLTGALAINLRLNSPSERELSALMDRPREGVEIIGVIADDPAFYKGRWDDRVFCSFSMAAEALNRLGFFQKARGEVRVTMRYDESEENEKRPSYGERWRLTGALIDKDFSSASDSPRRLDSVSPVRSPHQRRGSCLWQLTSNGVRNRIPCRFLFQVAPHAAGRTLLKRSRPWNILHWCFVLRQQCAATLSRGIAHRPDEAGVLQALLLGRRYELPAELREAFVATGTYHIFAISGQHVAIIAMFVVVVLQVHGIGRLNWFYYLAPVLIVFTIMAGMSTSAVRGCIMALTCFLGPLFKRKTDISSSMALAALLIVGADPLQLFQAGFILSFGIVAGLIVLCPALIAIIEKRIASDPYQLEPEKWSARSARNIIRWVLFLMAASLAAWLVSMPLVARWFNLVSLVSLPANLVVIPMATIILLTGCLSIVSGSFCPFAAEAFNFANVAFISLTTGVTKALAQVPFGHVFVRSPPAWFIFLWLGVLVTWRIYSPSPARWQGKRDDLTGASAAAEKPEAQRAKPDWLRRNIWLAAVLGLLIAGGIMWRSLQPEWEIHVFNISNSPVCIVNTSRGGTLLLNTGPAYQANRVLRYLRKMGVNRIQALLCPFPDAKHAGGAKDIISALPVNEIWCGTNKPDSLFMKKLRAEAGKRRIGVGELTNAFTPAAGHPDKSLTIFINAGVQTQMTARILIGNEREPLVIEIEETPNSLFRNTMPAEGHEGHCRIFCSPTVVERTQSDYGQSAGLQPPARIVLGPGQGVGLRPDKEKKINAVHLNLSVSGR